MKKVLFLTGPLNGGGAERVLIDILRHFDYSRYEVDLCCIVKGGTLANEVPKQVNVFFVWESYSLEYKILYHISNLIGFNALLRWKLRKAISKKYDAVISFLEGMPLKMHAILSPKALNISWVHCDLYNDPYEARQFRNNKEEVGAYNQMNKILCISKAAKESFHMRFPSVSTPVEVIYNPVDREKIIRMASEEHVNYDKFTIVCVGRMCPQKRFDRVVSLAHRLKSNGYDDIRIRIIGDGALRENLQNQAKEHVADDMVEFVGFSQNPFPQMKAADMLLLTSDAEGFSLVICEAMCLGVPVVSTKTAGPTEIIENDKYGVLCDFDDDSIYQAVTDLIDNPDRLSHYNKMSLKRAETMNATDTIRKIELLLNDESKK